LVLSKGKIGETYCIGGLTTDIDNISVVNKIIEIIGCNSTDITYVTDRKGHDLRYSVNWTKIHDELGWSPQHDFDSYLVKTVEWYKNNSQWWEDILSGKYKLFNQEKMRV
jgi:dTDP-glucose 4,6-dehydratase